MPIPPFDVNLVTPPHLGNPAASAADLSPYPCTSLELVDRFATSQRRAEILEGLLDMRRDIEAVGITAGFQWIAGSFTEDIEARERRPPNDVDVVTLITGLSVPQTQAIQAAYPVLADRDQTKILYHVDHIWVDIGVSAELTVEYVRYWLGLFSHRRDNVWKGILRLELGTPTVDVDARNHLSIAKANLP